MANHQCTHDMTKRRNALAHEGVVGWDILDKRQCDVLPSHISIATKDDGPLGAVNEVLDVLRVSFTHNPAE